MRCSTLWRTFPASGWSAARSATRCSAASRATSIWWWRATPRRSARLLGEEPLLHERFGTATATGERQPRRRRAASATSARVRCPRSSSARRSPRTSRAATSPSTRSPSGWRTASWQALPRRRSRTSRRGGCACCTSARSSTTPRGCCGWSATRRGCASRSRRSRASWAFAAVEGGALATVTPSRLGAELRLLLGRADAGGGVRPRGVRHRAAAAARASPSTPTSSSARSA